MALVVLQSRNYRLFQVTQRCGFNAVNREILVRVHVGEAAGAFSPVFCEKCSQVCLVCLRDANEGRSKNCRSNHHDGSGDSGLSPSPHVRTRQCDHPRARSSWPRPLPPLNRRRSATPRAVLPPTLARPAPTNQAGGRDGRKRPAFPLVRVGSEGRRRLPQDHRHAHRGQDQEIECTRTGRNQAPGTGRTG